MTSEPAPTTETDPNQVKFGKFTGRPVSTSAQTGSCIMLYSKGGGGKTSLGGSLAEDPETSPLWVLDAEGGTQVISDLPDEQCKIFDMKTWKDQQDFMEAIKRAPDPLPFKSIMLDNLSEMIQQAVTQIVGSDKEQVSQPKWGDMAREVLSLVRFYRDLARFRGVTVIIVAWDSFEKDEISGRAVYTLQATPKLQKELPGIVDHIGWITPIDGKPDRRLLTFEPSTRTISKMRRNRSEVARTIPFSMEYGLDNMPLTDIIASLKRGVPFPTTKYARPASNNTNK